MSAAPGWYPDPGGQAAYRYWDGRAWSAVTATTPTAAPPSGAAAPFGPPSTGVPGAVGVPGATGPAAGTGRRRAGVVGLVVGAVAVLGVVVLALVLVVRSLTASAPVDAPPPTAPATSASPCPGTQVSSSGSAVDGRGRVVSGKLSYPALGRPWSAPISDSRVPFGRDVRDQVVILETRDGRPSWEASVLIARLLAGDGFFGPQQGAMIVTSCILGRFYGDAEVKRDDRVNRSYAIDGHPGWLIESHLRYDIPDVKAKGELLIVAVVDVGGGEDGLFYASIPDTAPQLVDPARKALAQLDVG
ncbi:hypothetical protein FHX74_000966 [Friedmanniella endophytica]|uniref:DUF2510 domain-containing protein n=1 Tax=Microlunatus kandeliicorticis TaxID=1759536 RepID=A0A7W3IQG7_9ACTN|nr:DUF2510 domain-containing protein [Microlunatus kandeliicorticis]MBA8793361.1 hypothetical protein [Microlunatus kandeliicorticis]